MMKVWNVWLIFTTFLLSILGTFLTRSGVVNSVHAFAQSSIGTWFVWMLIVSFLVCLFFYVKNRKHLKAENKLESMVSRESSFLFNNLVLLLACFAVLWGTLFPILSELVRDNKITVGAPFYNKVVIPIGLFLLFLTGVGPLLAWRKTSFSSIRRSFAIPFICAVLTVLGLIAGGMHPWEDVAHFYSLVAFGLSALVVATIVSEFVRGGLVLRSKLETNLFGAMYHLTRRNMRRYGGYLVHFGVVVIVIGLAGAAFNKEQEQEMGLGDQLKIGNYTLVGQKYTDDDQPNFQSQSAILDVYKSGKFLGTLYPEIRLYKASQQSLHMVANRSTLQEDLYVIYEGKNQDTDRPIIKAFVNPLVSWIWIGVFIIIAGTGVALVPNAAQIKSPAQLHVTAAAIDDKRMQPVGVGK